LRPIKTKKRKPDFGFPFYLTVYNFIFLS
jgi:hypothetical protein